MPKICSPICSTKTFTAFFFNIQILNLFGGDFLFLWIASFSASLPESSHPSLLMRQAIYDVPKVLWMQGSSSWFSIPQPVFCLCACWTSSLLLLFIKSSDHWYNRIMNYLLTQWNMKQQSKRMSVAPHMNLVAVQTLSRVWFFAPCGLQQVRLLCPSVSPGACQNSGPLSWWCIFSKKDQIAINSMISFIIKLKTTAKHAANPNSDQLTSRQ